LTDTLVNTGSRGRTWFMKKTTQHGSQNMIRERVQRPMDPKVHEQSRIPLLTGPQLMLHRGWGEADVWPRV
jgi:hypothetical protein